MPAYSESRPDFELAGLELKSSPLKRIDRGKRLVPKERIALSMIDYVGILQEEWATSVRRTWEETVRRIRDGRADDLPKMIDSRIHHVRPHGRDSRDTLPTPKNGPLVKKCFWPNRDYLAAAEAP